MRPSDILEVVNPMDPYVELVLSKPSKQFVRKGDKFGSSGDVAKQLWSEKTNVFRGQFAVLQRVES